MKLLTIAGLVYSIMGGFLAFLAGSDKEETLMSFFFGVAVSGVGLLCAVAIRNLLP